MEATPSRLELSPLNFLRRAAVALGERPAVVHGERRLNYIELEQRCNRLASALRDRGLRRHDRVAILAPTRRHCSKRTTAFRSPAACSWR